MATTTNKVVVCNLALDYLGKTNVLDLTTTDTGRRCARQYDRTRRVLLAQNPWTFSRKIQALGLSSVNVLSETYDYAYDIPNDVLKIIKIAEITRYLNVNEPPIEHYIAGGKIYTNLESAYLLYVYDETDTSQWSDLFVDAVATSIAARLAPAMTRRKSDIAELKKASLEAFRLAAENDAAADPTTYRFGDGYVDARGSGNDLQNRQTDKSRIWG